VCQLCELHCRMALQAKSAEDPLPLRLLRARLMAAKPKGMRSADMPCYLLTMTLHSRPAARFGRTAPKGITTTPLLTAAEYGWVSIVTAMLPFASCAA
jgi:hypothetical protein